MTYNFSISIIVLKISGTWCSFTFMYPPESFCYMMLKKWYRIYSVHRTLVHMAGLVSGELQHHGAPDGNSCKSSKDKQEETLGRWYMSRKEIEENSPSRKDGVDLKKETYLRKSYCTFLQDLGMRLKVWVCCYWFYYLYFIISFWCHIHILLTVCMGLLWRIVCFILCWFYILSLSLSLFQPAIYWIMWLCIWMIHPTNVILHCMI